ncbi:MAG: ABC transporter ATP-binding protein [Lachnospiraceae bacterium]|nr:ABC transporter ATP-binding protein [Lachnospiraceae bacterium]
MISFEKVSKFILSEVSIHIPAGVTTGVIGVTGSGKTTLLKLACGLLQPERGSVYTLGREATIPSGRQTKLLPKELGVLFAHLPLLQPEESVRSNFQSRGLIYRMPKERFWREYHRLSERLGFAEFQQEKVQTLSLGQRRRAELGAVLLHQPKLLLLDEPTVGLDQNAKEALRSLLEEREADGLTTVITSHDMSDIAAVCGRIAVLNQGRLYAYGSRELLLKKYAPVDVMQLTLRSGVPNLEDLPVKSYAADNDKWMLIYDSNHITSAEILRTILTTCSVQEVSIHKPDLEDVLMRIEQEKTEVTEEQGKT